MATLIATLPVHLACQVICTGNYSADIFSFAVDTQLQNQTRELPNGYTAFPDVGVAYKFFRHHRTWNSARKHCIEEGGYLATVDSFKKIEYIMGMKDADMGPFVGFHRLFNRAEWTSVKTGLPEAMIPWATVTQRTEKNFSCTCMWANGSGIRATDCAAEFSFLCEIPLPMN